MGAGSGMALPLLLNISIANPWPQELSQNEGL